MDGLRRAFLQKKISKTAIFFVSHVARSDSLQGEASFEDSPPDSRKLVINQARRHA
jgi:hypothetical protein